MKARNLLPQLLMLACSTGAWAQYSVFMDSNISKADTVGQVEVLVQYDASALLDLTQKDKPVQETMMLEIGKAFSKFYSYPKFIRDSVYLADRKSKASNEIVNAHLNQYNNSRLNEITFKRYPTGKFTTLDEVGGCSLITCIEPEEQLHWTLQEDTTTFLTYACHKATCHFKGREWTAWFTPEIPVSEGPWKLCGLPGLILKAQDSEVHYTFTATGVEQVKSYRPILYSGQKHEPMTRKAYNKVHKRYYGDPVNFLNAIPGVQMTVRDEYGNKTNPKDLPYNPLERE